MGNLSDRQTRYLLAAFDAAPKAGDSFDYKAVGRAAGFSESEAKDLLLVLGKVGLIGPLRYGDTQLLTPEGREFARWIRESTRTISLSESEGNVLLAIAEATERG